MLVGWSCGFDSPAYKKALDIYDPINQVWTSTVKFCLDKVTCPGMMDENYVWNAGEDPRYQESLGCLEPTLGGGNATASRGFIDVSSEYALESGNVELTPDTKIPNLPGFCSGGFVQYDTVRQNDKFGISNFGIPWSGIQAPLTCEMCQLGYVNNSIINGGADAEDWGGLIRPGSFGAGSGAQGKSRLESPCDNTSPDRKDCGSTYVTNTNFYQGTYGSITGRNLRGVPKKFRPGVPHYDNAVAAGYDVDAGGCSTPTAYACCRPPSGGLIGECDYSVTTIADCNAKSGGFKWREYYPCGVGKRHLCHPDLGEPTGGRNCPGAPPGLHLSDSFLSDPRLPGICTSKHGYTHRLVVRLYENDTLVNDTSSPAFKDRYEWIYAPSLPDSQKDEYTYVPQGVRASTVRAGETRFRSRIDDSIITTKLSLTSKTVVDELRETLREKCDDCPLSNPVFKTACDRAIELIMTYATDKEIACENKMNTAEVDLRRYYTCKCNNYTEIVDNLIREFNNNACVESSATTIDTTPLSQSINAMTNRYKNIESSCLELLRDRDEDEITSREKEKGCCCQYFKERTDRNNRSYAAGSLSQCSYNSRVECSRITEYETRWSKCPDNCFEDCKNLNKPDECRLCDQQIVITEVSSEVTDKIAEVRKSLGYQSSERDRQIGSCCFERQAFDYEVPEGQDPSRYYVLDCVYGVSRGVCNSDQWGDTSRKWITDKPTDCTACDRSDQYCIQSGICNLNLKRYSIQSAQELSQRIASRMSQSTVVETDSTTAPVDTPAPTPPPTPPPSSPPSGGGYGY
jgi:hypothetical protein